MNTPTGIELLLAAARQHGLDSDPDHEVGDLQEASRKMWELMTPAQRLRLMADDDIREVVETNLPDINYDDQFCAMAEMQKTRLAIDGNNIGDIESALLASFPALMLDEEVNGADLVAWVGEHVVRPGL